MYIYLKKFSAFGSQNSQSTSKVTVAPIAGSFVNKDIHVRTDNVHKEDSNMKKSPSSDNFAREYSTSHTTSSKLALSSLPRNLSKKTLKKPLSGESQVFHKNYSKKNLGYRSIGADLNTYPRNGAVNVSMYFEHKKEKASTLNQALTNYYKIESIISKSSKKAEIRKDSVVDNSSRKIKRRNTQPDTRSVSSISGAASEISKVGFYGETLCEKLSLDFDKESGEDDCYWWEAVMR
ncbi:hypothetical protein AX774_g331 [Zancudomyces culisetae]|uniref:Uncharacterized protein n=1 Tax=Zancudomyces culisetae TaxID=1213189 RepID=A0A1R1PYQ4_ZANCU|nr:hypothetical protein AX774_g331 [Zancudomyces culisetae]|eukprot:OMH86102.1 hypothetical protein AX774_g331 [Zancudomyces culisetae]